MKREAQLRLTVWWVCLAAPMPGAHYLQRWRTSQEWFRSPREELANDSRQTLLSPEVSCMSPQRLFKCCHKSIRALGEGEWNLSISLAGTIVCVLNTLKGGLLCHETHVGFYNNLSLCTKSSLIVLLMPEMTLFIWNLFLLVKDVSKIYVACKARLDTEREKGGRVYIWKGTFTDSFNKVIWKSCCFPGQRLRLLQAQVTWTSLEDVGVTSAMTRVLNVLLPSCLGHPHLVSYSNLFYPQKKQANTNQGRQNWK